MYINILLEIIFINFMYINKLEEIIFINFFSQHIWLSATTF